MDSKHPDRDARTMNETKKKRLTRSRDDRYIGGVAAGLARYFNIDPTLVRVAFAVTLVIGGVGVLAYLMLLALVPVEGDPDAPAPPVTGRRRKVAIGGTIAVGIVLVIASASGGSGTSWLFGFAPGVLFGIFLWIAVAAGLFWAFRQTRTGGVKQVATSSAASPVPPATGSTVETGFATSPSQITPTAAAASSATAKDDPDPGERDTEVTPAGQDDTEVLPGGQPDTEVLPDNQPTAVKPVAPQKQRSSTPSTLGKVMTWVAIGLTGIVVLSILALISFALTALFGAIPAAVMVIASGVAVVWLALADRPQFALWATAAAIVIAIPMATVSIASLDIEGDWGDVQENPVSAAEIPADGYKMAAGALKIDLRQFPFRAGQTVELPTTSGFGATSVIVPDDVCVVGDIEGRVGYIYNRGTDWSGVDAEAVLPQPSPGVPVLRLDSEFRIGYFGVFDDSGWKGTGDNWPDDLEERNTDAAEARATAACEGGNTPGRDRPADAGPDRDRAGAAAAMSQGGAGNG
jgi:phage shock protein PspC (stress-responsive transcriptional regulator)